MDVSRKFTELVHVKIYQKLDLHIVQRASSDIYLTGFTGIELRLMIVSITRPVLVLTNCIRVASSLAIPVLGIIAATIATSVSADTLPQITIEDISYQGAFALPADSFTLVNPVSSDTNPTSSMNFAWGTIDVVGS